MSFFSNLINAIRDINAANKPPQSFVFGSIISGTYTNWKTDSHPTILCFGNFQKNNQWYVHGIQLHDAFSRGHTGYIIDTIKGIKNNGNVVNPYMFFNFLKINKPDLIKNCYRTYISSMCDFKTINPGFSNINEKYCYPINDDRDQILKTLNQNGLKIMNLNLNTEQLRKNITAVINTVKVW